MSRVLLFPGLNGLLNLNDRLRFSADQEILNNLKNSSDKLSSRLEEEIDLQECLLSKDTHLIYSNDYIPLSAGALLVIQQTLANRILKEKDWLLGCSLGDTARSAVAGVFSLEDAVYFGTKIMRGLKEIHKIGSNIGVSSKEPFSNEQIEKLAQTGIDISFLTPRFLNIGATHEEIQTIKEMSLQYGWRVATILQFPAHCRHLTPIVKEVSSYFDQMTFSPPQRRVFSSIYNKEIIKPETFKIDMLDCLTKPVQWVESIKSLRQNYGLREFINIGPCDSLTRMMKDIDPSIDIKNSWEINS